MPSAERKSDKTQIGLFIRGRVYHFGGDYDIIHTNKIAVLSIFYTQQLAVGPVLNRGGKSGGWLDGTAII